jgi:hypothetical protein
MNITYSLEGSPWLLLVFSLPSSKASERVGIWRKLQKFGSIRLPNAGYVLPNNPVNQERFEWLATAIRSFKGEASILQIKAIDDLQLRTLQEQFRQARAADYEALIEETKKLKPAAKGASAQITRLRRRYEDIVAIDFFESPIRRKAEDALMRAEQPRAKAEKVKTGTASKADYQNRIWMTRPRPGIDRVSSAWLIARFIDPKATFVFGKDPSAQEGAIPFDMFRAGGFGHEGDNCTFETLCHAFRVTDRKVQLIAQAIHDADLEDDKFGRSEGNLINQILHGWAKQAVPDEELLRRGMDLIEGLYDSIR